jgi:hypothetical protein
MWQDCYLMWARLRQVNEFLLYGILLFFVFRPTLASKYFRFNCSHRRPFFRETIVFILMEISSYGELFESFRTEQSMRCRELQSFGAISSETFAKFEFTLSAPTTNHDSCVGDRPTKIGNHRTSFSSRQLFCAFSSCVGPWFCIALGWSWCVHLSDLVIY